MSEIHGATGSYVLNALDPSELDEFEAHLAVCPTCSQEVVEFCETAAALSLLATAPPPPALKGSVMAAIAGVRVLPPEPSEVEEPAPAQTSAPVAAAPLDELALRRQQRRARILSLAVAAVTVVALSLGGWVFSLVQQQQSQVASSNLETQLYSAPDVVIKPVTLPNGAKGSFVASKSLNRAMFTSSDLPSPGTNRAYQLWTLKGSAQAPTVVPDNTLSGGTAVKQFFRGDIAGSTLVAISNEPEGGSPSPTTTPTVVQL
jgi:anti-sigma-K factor RskA